MTQQRIGIIVGSVREKSESGRIAEYVGKLLQKLAPDVGIEMFRLRDLDVPLWHEDKWVAGSEMQAFWKPISERLKACDGFVVISPEWAGMAPAHLKNFLLMCDGGELAHKPAQLIGVSSGMGGAYPIAELRMSGYKNNFLMWLPDHMILRHVVKLFASEPPTALDEELTARMEYGLEFLLETAKAMGPVREKVQKLHLYKTGM
ncbi:MAG: NADPH-dependent oxidoreductase [Sneathiella sp.]|jgi:NAD(P)H-dependent FMN reductase|uniref:NADPH-dependent FMN reductase n=1 Tax=Sneathiella sp. TaxID=1964365 RepID=UPI000C48D530|nr:NAD(P)H-dependent oxidoreductase [Sneathiella sp.]MAL79627.1 NADPH-dependent oxidoreductase [Sneathiella sp.]